MQQVARPPATATTLGSSSVRSRLENVQDRLANFATRLAALGDRVEGPAPALTGVEAGRSSAAVVPINNQLNSVDTLVEYINNEIVRLENSL